MKNALRFQVQMGAEDEFNNERQEKMDECARQSWIDDSAPFPL